MNWGSVLYRLVETYVLALVGIALLTGVWLFAPRVTAAPTLAGVWFAVGGFGVLVLLMMILSFYMR